MREWKRAFIKGDLVVSITSTDNAEMQFFTEEGKLELYLTAMRRSQVALRVVNIWFLEFVMLLHAASIVRSSGLAAKYGILARWGGEISMIIRFSHTYRKRTWSINRQIQEEKVLTLRISEFILDFKCRNLKLLVALHYHGFGRLLSRRTSVIWTPIAENKNCELGLSHQFSCRIFVYIFNESTILNTSFENLD